MHMTSATILPGSELPGKVFDYEVIDYLGNGAASAIYVVVHPHSGQLYALKHIRRRGDKDQRFFDQLHNEFELCRRFTHPTLRRAIELRDNRTLLRKPTEAALVLELFDGATIEVRPPADTLALLDCFIHVASGLASLNAMGLVHCDLKPNNILIGADGAVKIIDFGQTCRSGTIKARIQGTADFIAPEQVKRQPVTARTDVFNLGATLYWALAGRPIPTLFTLKHNDNSFLLDDRIAAPHEINPLIPEPLSNLVMECVRSNPDKRPASMKELRRRLELVHHAVRRQTAVA
jgi:eukaryotic-like serine/threonine-protein kinase